MKKILLATALLTLAGLASAQATVELYGKMRMYEENYRAGTGSNVNQVTSDYSRIGIRGSEDLGGGLKANFTVETGINLDAPSATTLGDRQSTVGLSNRAGSIDLGRAKHSIGRALDNFDAFGNALFSSIYSVHANQGSRLSNAAFISVTPINGVTVNYHQGASENATVRDVQAGSIDYAAGKFAATVARYDNKISSTSTLLGARYTLVTGTTLYGTMSDDKVVGVASKGKTIGVAQPLSTNLTALVSYGKKDDQSATNNDVKATNVGANYALSKRTTVLARYIKEDASVVASNIHRVALGVEHNF